MNFTLNGPNGHSRENGNPLFSTSSGSPHPRNDKEGEFFKGLKVGPHLKSKAGSFVFVWLRLKKFNEGEN